MWKQNATQGRGTQEKTARWHMSASVGPCRWARIPAAPLIVLFIGMALLGSASSAQAQAPGCSADLDETGVVGVPDLLQLLSCWGTLLPGDTCEVADIDGGGVVGVPDLLALLSQWGECPMPEGFCGDEGAGNCCIANGSPYCNYADCCESVCADDAFCCGSEWDEQCAAAALALCSFCSYTSCAGQCGGGSSFCFCDAECLDFGDCCTDVCDECGYLGCDDSCNSSCGGTAWNCWCDSSCFEYGDCCVDVCLWCDQWYCD